MFCYFYAVGMDGMGKWDILTIKGNVFNKKGFYTLRFYIKYYFSKEKLKQ